MSPRGRHRAAGVVLGALLAARAAPADLPRNTGDWVRVDSDHFTLFSDADPGHVRALAADLERLRAALLGLVPGLARPAPRPTSLFVFRDERAFRPYRRLDGATPAKVAGFFASHERGDYLAIDGSPRSEPRRVLYHEYLHQVVAAHFPAAPLWLNEGLAELYSSVEVDGETARVGLPIREHLDWLERHSLIPLPELFAMDRSSPDYHEGSRRGVFYAESWALVHHLLIGAPERQPQTVRFLELCREGTPPADALVEAFDTTSSGLERELRESVRALLFSYVRVPVGAAVATESRIEPLAPAEVLYRLGDLLIHTAPHLAGEAGAHFEAALDLDPDHAPSIAGRGIVAAHEGDHAAAHEHYRRAAELAPDDVRIQTLWGESLLQRALGGGGPQPLDPGGETADLLAAARAVFRRVVELAPDHAAAWAGLGTTHTLDRRPPPAALAALERARRDLPDRPDLAFNLALLYARAGRRQDAVGLVESVLVPKSDGDLVAQAREGILQAELLALDDLLAAERLAEALALVEHVYEETTDAALQRQLGDQAATLRDAIAELDFTERYNEAVGLANGGRVAEAVEVLEDLAESAASAEHRELAADLRDRLKSFGR